MIDWERVRELQDEIGSDDFAEVVELFLDEVDTVIQTLHDSTGLNELEEAMHFLKGSALSLGFKEFASLCQAGESAAKAGAEVQLGSVVKSYTESRSQFVTELATQIAT